MKPEHQVVASAANMARALDAGMPRDFLMVLVTARAEREAGADLSVDVVQLGQALHHPAALAFDEVFVRRELHRHPR